MVLIEVTSAELSRLNQYSQAKIGTIYLAPDGGMYYGNAFGKAVYNGKSPKGSIQEVDKVNLKVDKPNAVQKEDVLVPSYVISKELMANENIYKYDVVTADGYRANSNIVSKRNKTYGMAVQDIRKGEKGVVVQLGDVYNEQWNLPIGSLVFLNGDTIDFSAPAVGFTQMLGKVIHQQILSVNIKQAVLL